MGSKLRIAIFASGQGSNFQAIADAVQHRKLDCSIELLVCDKPAAPVVERAHQSGVEAFVFQPKQYASRADYEAEILLELQKRSVDLIVLAGYMRIITNTLVEPYYGKMINIHPSLLPAFPGVAAMEQALEYGVKVTGVTVHFVDGGMDTGPIIAQQAVDIRPDETIETLAARIHAVEQELYPAVINQIANQQIKLTGRHVQIITNAN
ncbi:phosphoribosylglycinamide formyltransferase [Paenibacillus yanchengensis]|uniref:Phosphoribosylglycinamide formyltransferase n=1 Tax=Paenibacillus yanchengensis TaxID=2035833 RepID=A0ABW4YFP6_9BACL